MNPVTHPFFLLLEGMERPELIMALFGLVLLSFFLLLMIDYFSERLRKKKIYHRPNDLVKPE